MTGVASSPPPGRPRPAPWPRGPGPLPPLRRRGRVLLLRLPRVHPRHGRPGKSPADRHDAAGPQPDPPPPRDRGGRAASAARCRTLDCALTAQSFCTTMQVLFCFSWFFYPFILIIFFIFCIFLNIFTFYLCLPMFSSRCPSFCLWSPFFGPAQGRARGRRFFVHRNDALLRGSPLHSKLATAAPRQPDTRT